MENERGESRPTCAENREVLFEKLRNRGCRYQKPQEAVSRVKKSGDQAVAKDPLLIGRKIS